MADIYTKFVLTLTAFFLAALTAMELREFTRPTPAPLPEPPFAGIQFTSPNNATIRMFDSNTGDVWFYGWDGWSHEGRIEKTLTPGRGPGWKFDWHKEPGKGKMR